jgi:hypothetical protein
MSALANECLAHNSDRNADGLPIPDSWEDNNMRARLVTLRDTLLVVAVQIIFRATLALRRWNY